jgi:hypothetical protein
MKNPRRAYDEQKNEIKPMNLGNMRSLKVRSVWAECLADRCRHEALVSVDRLPDDLPVPDVGLRFRCSKCGGRRIKTMPDWSDLAKSFY